MASASGATEPSSHHDEQCAAPPAAPNAAMPRRQDVPRHPIESMQAAFAESMAEVAAGTLDLKPKLRPVDAATRRELLMDQDKSEGPPAAQWRMRPGQECHELRKLIAQVSFGVYLLMNAMANSNAQVVSILQGHIDEVDEFLEMTMEDIALATQDLTKRLDLLKLPMDNMAVFEQMLEDRAFRLQIVEGNVQIEHIVSRTTTALVQSMQDIVEGLKTTKEFADFLARNRNGRWREARPDVMEIYEAMQNNTDGWLNAFTDLQGKANTLNALIVKLNTMVLEMDKRAGEVSRQTRFSVKPFTSPVQPAHSPKSSHGSSQMMTPPASPGVKVAISPPRLSLRFSSIQLEDNRASNYFNLPGRDSLFARESIPVFEYTPAQTPDNAKEAEAAEDETPNPIVESLPEPPVEAPKEPEEFEESEEPEEPKEPDEPEEPEELEELEEPEDKEQDVIPDSPDPNDGPLYILQPRTYTPLPPAPLPSPRVLERPADLPFSTRGAEQDSRMSAPALQPRSSRRNLSSPTSDEPMSPRRSSPRFLEQPQATRQPSLRVHPELREVASEKPLNTQRTSLRQRVSLRATPPTAIHVPPPELQKPVFASPKTYQNYQTFTGPDSAYGSDVERPPLPSAGHHPSAPTISPPVFPGMVPSPQSDQQYFRPVQASPYSPLQQRPHTAGANRPHHIRNQPSAMGMSMLSTVSTLNPENPTGGRTLKKKRSAFGWLKKAFTLDEEERAAFDARKLQQPAPNLYYDTRSPKFLDGRRIR